MSQVLFVHGMGRSPLSGWPMLRRLRQAGLATNTFGYFVSTEKFEAICRRLASTIAAMPDDEALILIGHSLGGVLIRAALAVTDQTAGRPLKPPQHVFLLASPQRACQMALRLQHRRFFRALTGDCGQLLANPVAMAALPSIGSRLTSIVGTRSIPFNRTFGDQVNDGVVALSEVRAAWIKDEVQVDLIHSVLPASQAVAEVVLERLARTLLE
jgi:hypothetical protein